MKKNNLMLQAAATFMGTVIGAGILGVPYVVSQAGLFTGIFLIFALGIISAIIYMYLGETVLRTKENHQLTGYAEKYLGKKGKILMAFSMLIGIYGALIAYTIGEGKTFASILGVDGRILFSLIGWNFTTNMLFSLLFFIIMAVVIYEGIEAVGRSEYILMPIMLIIIALICIISFFHTSPQNFTGFNLSKILLPYGVILFAFLGATAIPEMQLELKKNKHLLKRSIMIGIAIPLIFYTIFAIAIVGVTGSNTTEVATIGLGETIGPYMMLFGNLFAIFAMATSFLALGLALQEMYEFDYNMSKFNSWALTCFPPIIVTLLGLTSFVGIIGLGGVIAGGIDGILIILMAHKAKTMGNREPEFSMPVNKIISALLIFLYFGGAIYYFWTLI